MNLYKTELHCHTKEASACGKETPESVVEKYIEAGYTTLVITNHMCTTTFMSDWYADYLKSTCSEDSWQTKVDFYIRDYKKAVAAAKGRINVILGIELRFDKESINDYLIYGATEEWLRSSEKIRDMKVKEFYPYAKETGVLIYHAHPLRNGMMVVKPDYLDGYEVYNGNLGKDNRNDLVELWAERYNKPGISGSDYHSELHVIGAGIATDFPITSNDMLLEVLKTNNYKLIKGGDIV